MKNKKDLFAVICVSLFVIGVFFSTGFLGLIEKDSAFCVWGVIVCFPIFILIAASGLSASFASKFSTRWVRILVFVQGFILSIGILLLPNSLFLIPALGIAFNHFFDVLYWHIITGLFLSGGSLGITLVILGAIAMVTDHIKRKKEVIAD